MPGLVWKLWGYDDDQCVATSIYLFDSESTAREWGDGPIVPALSAHPGITDIEVRYFDIEQELSTVRGRRCRSPNLGEPWLSRPSNPVAATDRSA